MSVVKCTSLLAPALSIASMMFFGTVVIDRIEEIMALGADLQRRQHLGRQVVDHVTFGDWNAGDHVRPGHIAFDDRCIAIKGTVVIDDVGDDDLFAICEQFLCKMTTDKAVAAEKDVFHRVISFAATLILESCAVCCVSPSALSRPDWAISTVPTQMKAIPAMRQLLRSSLKSTKANTATAT
jgi:hypothetical protein